MELNIHSPAYFSEHYGVDDDVYRYCQKLYTFFLDKQYSDSLSTIGLMPAAAPEELYAVGQWKESVRFIDHATCAIIHIRLDFDRYYHADSTEKIELMRDAILKAVKKISSKSKIDLERFEKDLRSAIAYSTTNGKEPSLWNPGKNKHGSMK